MSRYCQVTGKGPLSGNHVSHANNKTRRRFLPNLQRQRFWVQSERRWVRLRVSRHGLRIIEKKGIEQVLAELRGRAGTAQNKPGRGPKLRLPAPPPARPEPRP